jgi:hypothetical protein
MALSRDDLKSVRQRKFLAKDFDGLRAQLLEYARQYYPDRIKDFSESSMGGVLLDMAAYVGDNMSFYLDHQYGELNPDTAVETANIERSLRTAGVPIVGAAPALVPVTIYIQLPAARVQNVLGPQVETIPVVQAGSVFTADNGVDFILIEDVDFNKKRSDGRYFAEIRVGQKSSLGIPSTFIMIASGLCISGKEATENISIGATFVPFRTITLSYPDVSEITSINDGFGNIYHQVAALSHDVVYRNVLNTAKDNELVKDAIKVIPAPFRYMSDGDLASRRTVLTFGGGNADTLEDDVIPDPSDFAIAFPYSRTFSRIPVNPQQLLQTKTLGVAAVDTTLSINYRYGGGLHHNVSADSIKIVKTLKMHFPGNPSPATAASIKGSIEVTNKIQASGGEDAPSIDELKELIPSIRNSQERIASREDLIARVYTLPSNFGRVFRAAIRSNPNNPLATQLFIVSRDPDSKLITSPDTLKRNLRSYLNPYRMISDAIDILDARIINLTLAFDVLIDPSLNRSVVLQNVLAKLQSLFNIKNFHIDQPIVISDITNNIFTVPGIISINNIQFQNAIGTIANREYSSSTFDVSANTRQGIIFPPPGSIFEMRYPEFDILGKVAS